MEIDFRTLPSASLKEIISVTGAKAGSLIIADLAANMSERVVAESIQGIADINAYKQWLRQFLSHKVVESASQYSKVKNDLLLDLLHSDIGCTWAPAPVIGIRLPGKDLIQAFVFLSLEKSGKTSEDIVRAVAEIGNRCLTHFHDMVPSSARDLIRRIGFIGTSNSFRALEDKLKRVARQADAPVLITGERGAGKELAALAIHYYSARRDKPFLAINCAALHSDLYAAELFGYRRGAFTGALRDRPGKFKAAEGGTLFLDEITEIPPAVCAGLLRALDQGEIQSLGCDSAIKVNVRVLAATNKNIRSLVDEKKFPADVFDRLNVLSLHVPSLRERREDISLLVSYFCRKFCLGLAAQGTDTCKTCMETGQMNCLEEEVIQKLTTYSWPGNIRELKNTVIKLITESEGNKIAIQHLPAEIRGAVAGNHNPGSPSLVLEIVLRDHIYNVLELTKWNKSAAARILGLPLSTLVSKMKRLRISSRENVL